MIIDELFEAPQQCPECGGISFSNLILAEKKDACYYKVKASAKVWPSAYASGRLVQCRKKGAANYGNKSEGVMEMDKSQTPPGRDGSNNPDAGKKEYTAKIITPKKAAKDGEKILNKVFNKKKGMAEEYELAGVGVAYDLGRRAYRERKTIKDNPYSATKEARKYDEWEKGLERGKHDANDARLFRSSVGEQGMAEGQLELNTPDPVVVVQDLKGKILDKINLSVAAQKYKLGQPQNIKTQLAHQNYTTIGNYVIVSPMSGQPQDQTTTGQKQAFTATEGEQQPGADYRDPKEVDYNDEYDAMVARVKKLAGLGPMKTVYDPARRQYRNMPTAQQPKK